MRVWCSKGQETACVHFVKKGQERQEQRINVSVDGNTFEIARTLTRASVKQVSLYPSHSAM
jgi:hypothetical protein